MSVPLSQFRQFPCRAQISARSVGFTLLLLGICQSPDIASSFFRRESKVTWNFQGLYVFAIAFRMTLDGTTVGAMATWGKGCRSKGGWFKDRAGDRVVELVVISWRAHVWRASSGFVYQIWIDATCVEKDVGEAWGRTSWISCICAAMDCSRAVKLQLLQSINIPLHRLFPAPFF